MKKNINPENTKRLANVEPVNTNVKSISSSLKNKHIISNSNKDTETQTIFNLLINDVSKGDLDEYAESFKYERDNFYLSSQIDINDYLWEINQSQMDIFLPDARIIKGFNSGFIDLGATALAKTDEGWIDENKNIVLSANADINEILNYANKYVRLLPTYELSDLEKSEKDGVFLYKGEQRAVKNEEGNWIDCKDFPHRNKTFPPGDLIRLLHHSNIPLFINAGKTNTPIYHGNISTDIKPENEHKIRKNSSRWGDAIYGTGSIDEAVRIYANPKSFENKSKLISDQERGTITKEEKNNFVFGHLYELETSCSLYTASLTEKYLDTRLVPSLSSIMLQAKIHGVNEKFAFNTWMRMKSSCNTYDVYTALNEFCNTVIETSGKNNTFSQILSGMGFDGVDLKIPNKEEIKKINDTITDLKNTDESDFNFIGLRKESVIKRCENYLESIKNSIPAKAKENHLIIFDKSKVTKKHLKTLPINLELINKKDEFYSSEKELFIEDIDNCPPPNFDMLKNFWREYNENKDNNREIKISF